MKIEIINVEKFIKERVEENKELFNKKELDIINQYESIIKKIYLLGFINAKNCYNKI